MDLFPILSLILITVTIIADNAIKNKKTIESNFKKLKEVRFSKSDVAYYSLVLLSSFFLKPFLTYLFSPHFGKEFVGIDDPRYKWNLFNELERGEIRSDKPEVIQFHFENIFSYEPAFFIYSFMLALIIYFIATNLNLSNTKSKTEFQKRVDKLNDLRKQNIITDQEYDTKLSELKKQALEDI